MNLKVFFAPKKVGRLLIGWLFVLPNSKFYLINFALILCLLAFCLFLVVFKLKFVSQSVFSTLKVKWTILCLLDWYFHYWHWRTNVSKIRRLILLLLWKHLTESVKVLKPAWIHLILQSCNSCQNWFSLSERCSLRSFVNSVHLWIYLTWLWWVVEYIQMKIVVFDIWFCFFIIYLVNIENYALKL